MIDDGTRIMCRAYSELSTERSIGMGIGPIPWSKMIEWCDRHWLYRDVADHVVLVLRLVDQETLRREASRARSPTSK